MSEIKVNLSLTLPGSVLLSEQECSKNSKKKDCYDYFRIGVVGAKGKNKEVINVAVRKSRTVKQNIKLSKEAYDYMTNGKVCPNPKLRGKWDNYTTHQRIKYHCSQIAESLGAIDFSFEILED